MRFEAESGSEEPQIAKSEDFSIVLGGPLFQILRRAHLSDDALRLVRQRVVVIALLAWLPLLLLTTLEGTAFGATVAVPFLLDVEVYTRFLLAMPLLIVAELIVHRRMRHLVQLFHERKLIPENSEPAFQAAIASAFRFRNSLWPEVALIGLVYGLGISLLWRHYLFLDANTWYATKAAGSTPSLAGVWYLCLSLPMFQFLLCRWYLRFFIWARFLWQVSRIDLSLVPTHPDRVGGLGFLSNAAYAFLPVLVAHGVLLSGVVGNRIYYLGATLADFKYEILALVVFLMLLVLGPLLVFSPQLAAAKRAGLREYGTLAEQYIRQFDEKWLRSGTPRNELLGSGDVQSLADLNNCFEVVRTMRVVPIDKDSIIQLGIATALPFSPLVLTMLPFEEILKKLLGILL